jgi:hypothetical protein
MTDTLNGVGIEPHFPEQSLSTTLSFHHPLFSPSSLFTTLSFHRGNLSFFLGGKSPSDKQQWTPNLEAVRASIRFAISTGRLDAT